MTAQALATGLTTNRAAGRKTAEAQGGLSPDVVAEVRRVYMERTGRRVSTRTVHAAFARREVLASSLTYADPTGERAVARIIREVIA